jgi:translation initiation factor 4E
MSSELVLDEGVFPLERKWAVWFSGPAAAPPPARQARGRKPEKPEPLPPKRIGDFACIVAMWQQMKILPAPSCYAVDGSLYVFQEEIDPFWEHPCNANGGRWMFSIPTEKNGDAGTDTDAAWRRLWLALAGETLDPDQEVTGIILSRRRFYTRFSIWTKDKLCADRIMQIGGRIKDQLSAGVKIEYQDHGAQFGDYRYTL